MRTSRFWRGQGARLAFANVGSQSVRWRSNIFQIGLGIWRVPIRKQAFNEVFTRSSDPLPIVVGFYAAWQRAHSFQHGPVDLPLSHRTRANRFWNGQGPHLASMIVGLQSARWRSNIFSRRARDLACPNPLASLQRNIYGKLRPIADRRRILCGLAEGSFFST